MKMLPCSYTMTGGEFGQRELLEAISYDDVAEVRRYIEEKNVCPCFVLEGYSPICVASERGNVDVLNMLIEAKCDLAQPDFTDHIWFRRPIHIAAAKGHLSYVQALLKVGVDVDCRDGDEKTALHWASTHGHVQIAEYLIRMGASVNIAQMDRFTPLHAATCLGHLDICELLIQYGAKVDMVDRDGWAPIHTSTCYGYIKVVEMLIRVSADINRTTNDNETALHIAASCGHLHIVKLLVSCGIDLEGQTLLGFTAFHLAVYHNRYEVAKYLITENVTLNTANNAGLSPLYTATLRADSKMIKLLVHSGYNVNSEGWLRLKNPPFRVSPHEKDMLWLLNLVGNPKSLSDLCVLTIRRQLGKKLRNAKELNLPTQLKEFVSFEFLR
ncbi:serine/threonine-protein phosphatase 6 regulatory ankyrin repeat subunit B-like [Argonauta hians]